MKLISENWKDYELLDCGDGMRLERWGTFFVSRPDPQVLWPKSRPELWKKATARYHRSSSGGGKWEGLEKLPKDWSIRYNNLQFLIRPTDFKHMGLFPEQAVNWDWCADKIRNANRPIRLLNLFAYTGGATVSAANACGSEGEVCHVDAAKGMVTWAKENLHLSRLGDRKVRFIVDDVLKFVQREERRNSRYDAIIMDPPSYGRGSKGEMWKIEKDLYPLLQTCAGILTEEPLFFLINSYTTGLSPLVLENILQKALSPREGKVSGGEVALRASSSDMLLPCGVFGRWERE